MKVQDLGNFDFCLPCMNIIYFNESQLISGIDVAAVKMAGVVTVIADRNILTVEAFTKVGYLPTYILCLGVLK